MAAAVAAMILPVQGMAHGYAGKRFFPATMAVDDPFVADEAGIQFSRSKDEMNTATTDMTVDYAKTISPNFALSINTDYVHVKPEGNATQNGFANTVVGGKYLLYENNAHETLFSVGANVELVFNCNNM